MKKCLAFIIFLCCAGEVWGQPTVIWNRTIVGSGDCELSDAVISPTGGYAFVGDDGLSSFDNHYPFIGFVSASGDCVWTRRCDTLLYDEITAIANGSNSNFVLAGTRYDSSCGTYYRATSEGMLTYRSRIHSAGRVQIASLVPATGGNFVACGYRRNGGSDPGWGMLAIKLNINGDTIWTTDFRPSLWYLSESKRIIPTHTGGYMILGFTRNSAAPLLRSDFYLGKLNENGSLLWARTYGDTTVDNEGEAICETNDGGFLLVGNTSRPGFPLCSIRIIRINSDGSIVWNRVLPINYARYPWAQDVTQAWNGGWVIAGSIDAPNLSGRNYLLIGISDSGDTTWTVEYNSGGDGNVMRILPAIDDGYVLAAKVLGNGFTRHSIQLLRISRETSISSEPELLTTKEIISAFPNPFNSTTTLKFSLPSFTNILELTVYDVLGREVLRKDLHPAVQSFEYRLDASGWGSGVYLVCAQTLQEQVMQKILLLK
jgi:hypothetical protein